MAVETGRDNQTLFGAVAVLAAVLGIGYFTVGPVAFLYSMAFIGGLGVWLLTAYRTAIPIERVLPAYLLTVMLFIGHVCEEYLAHIERALGQIMHIVLTQQEFLLVAAFASPIIWLAGPLLVIRGYRFGYFFICVFLFGMMFGELSHFLFPFLENGTFHYVAGMYTCLLPIAGGWLTFAKLLRAAKSGSSSAPDLGGRHGRRQF